MPLTQDDIRAHYEKAWRPKASQTVGQAPEYGDAAANQVMLAIFARALRDLNIAVDGGRVLDVGVGAGRWSRCILEQFKPASLLGVDYTQASVDLLTQWATTQDFGGCAVSFEVRDITEQPTALPPAAFDLIVIANVLFHVPEADKFTRAMQNLAAAVKPDGRIILTDYLPRMTMRTQWMLVRSRYDFEAACRAAGLGILDVRPLAFFTNDPMGIDGPDTGPRHGFQVIRNRFKQLAKLSDDPTFQAQVTAFAVELDRCLLDYCSERIAPVDFPSQKLIVLGRDGNF
jgi:2-polyprenyl-3-methyl-5-hydroxy-6-metoxy-1,4-benzoquinol methylase